MTITAVHRQPSGLWLITDSAGVRYATKNALLVSVALAMHILKAPVSMVASTGWYYRELHQITQRVPDAPLCGRCQWYRATPFTLQCRRCKAIKRADDGYGYR